MEYNYMSFLTDFCFMSLLLVIAQFMRAKIKFLQMFSIPAREKIGRAKSVPANQYMDNYANIMVEMDEEINAIAEKGEEAL